MSMLTPPGMGGKYRITGSKYPRMRRPRHRRRIVLAAVAAVVALGLLGWGTVQLIDVFTADEGPTKTTTASARKPDCKPSPSAAAVKRLPEPAQIKVNVYNATPRSGLAKTTADELKKRGFVIGKVGNAPAAFDKKIPGTGLLLGAPAAADGPFTVLGAQLKGTKSQHDARTTKDVDLLLGTAFKSLDMAKDADRTLATLTRPTPGAPC